MTTLIPKDSFLGKTAEVLGYKIIDTKFFIFDLWMIIHLIIGFGLGLIFLAVKKYKATPLPIPDWIIILGILILYELFEIALRGIFFEKEIMVNILWDLVFGMGGFFIAKLIFKF